METLTIDTLRTLARMRGLDVTDEELSQLLPLVQGARAVLQSMAALPLDDVEPAAQFRML
jgi:hypothetical protein